jgi:uncharacterized protein (DUF885 family)
MFAKSLATTLFVSLLAAGCGGAPATGETAATPAAVGGMSAAEIADATAGVENPQLKELLLRDWDLGMHEAPVFATSVGDHRFDDRLSDPSWSHALETREKVKALVADAKKLRELQLSAHDREILELYIDLAEPNVEAQVCDFELWSVGPGGADPFEALTPVAEKHAVKTAQDAANLIARYKAMPAWLDTTVENIRRGAKEGKIASAALIKADIEETDITLALPLDQWELANPAKADHPDWKPEELAKFRADLMATLPPIKDALKRYRDALSTDLLPHGRSEDKAGLGGLPNGLACYKAMIRGATSLPMTAEELHKLGEDEVARAEKEFADLGEQIFHTRNVQAINEKIRSDKAMYFTTSDEIMKTADQVIERTRAKLPQYFGILPKAKLIVRPMEPAEAAVHAAPFYQEANTDGSKPGEYRINLSKPETRSRWDAENSAFHEGLPGHHLQVAIAQELEGVPAFLKYGGLNSFVEGWALYTERLADEMGLYSGPIDRLGMVEWDRVRGARLVVDTGIHALGWSPEKARKYFHEHTAMADSDIAQEIDRYTSSPAQALSYKVGDIAIRRLRQKAKDELGAKFDIRGFHDTVLGHGAVTLGVLERNVNAWIAEKKKG